MPGFYDLSADAVVQFLTGMAATGFCLGVVLRYFRKLRNRRKA